MLLLGLRSQYRKKCDREHANVLTKLFKQHPFGCRLTLNSLLPHVVSEQQATCKGTVWVLTLCPPSLIRNIDLIVLPAFGPLCFSIFSVYIWSRTFNHVRSPVDAAI